MFVTIGGWLAAHWKVIASCGAVAAAAAGASLDHVNSADARFVEIETQAKVEVVRDSAAHSVIQKDVAIVKCIILHQVQGLDPLRCIQ